MANIKNAIGSRNFGILLPSNLALRRTSSPLEIQEPSPWCGFSVRTVRSRVQYRQIWTSYWLRSGE